MLDESADEIQQNIFGLEDANNCFMQIWAYHIGHQELLLQTYTKNKILKIHFSKTEYFSGTTNWIGANICLYPKYYCITFLEQYKPEVIKLFRNTDLLDSFFYQFYTIPTKENNFIQIIAASPEIVESSDY